MHAETKRTDTDREYYEKFLKSVCGVILLASPSHGSSLANFFAPLTAVPAAISGGMSTLVHNDHLVALKPSSGELKDITKEFEEFCKWFEAQCGRKLKVAALRETKKLGLAMVSKYADTLLPAQYLRKLRLLNRSQRVFLTLLNCWLILRFMILKA